MAFPCGHPRPPPLQPAPLAFTVASRAGADWEYYSTAFSIAPGAVYHKQQQKAPYARYERAHEGAESDEATEALEEAAA